jgi:hypothetical protein
VTFLPDGYADHLSELTAHGGSRPAQGNARYESSTKPHYFIYKNFELMNNERVYLTEWLFLKPILDWLAFALIEL